MLFLLDPYDIGKFVQVELKRGGKIKIDTLIFMKGKTSPLPS